MKKIIFTIFLVLTVTSCSNIDFSNKKIDNGEKTVVEVKSEGPIKNGDKIQITYTGSLEDGTIFDASSKHHDKPLEFTVGDRYIIPGLNKGVVGMKLGENKTIQIAAKDAYGETNEILLSEADFKQIEAGGLKKEDMKLGLNKIVSNGKEVGEVEILRIEDGKYFAKHPSKLAGKNLIFQLKIDKITPYVQKTEVRKGDKISVFYTGSLEDGSIFDASSKHGGQPLPFTVGAGQMIAGFDAGVVGMKLNEIKKIKIEAKDAYGETGNHQLAGKNLIFDVKVVEIK